jgi:hypothetical protein
LIQMVECLFCKYEALSSNSSATKKQTTTAKNCSFLVTPLGQLFETLSYFIMKSSIYNPTPYVILKHIQHFSIIRKWLQMKNSQWYKIEYV